MGHLQIDFGQIGVFSATGHVCKSFVEVKKKKSLSYIYSQDTDKNNYLMFHKKVQRILNLSLIF